MFAAFVGSLRCVELLLEYGADPLIRTRQGALAFAFAEENGHEGIAGMLRHRAADAQAESQAMKEQKEALLARQKAKQAILLRKKQEQAYVQRIEEQRRRAAIERQNYLSSFPGQLEMLSVGCYVSLDRATSVEMVKILMNNKWDQTIRTKKRFSNRGVHLPAVTSNGVGVGSVSVRSDFELLHKDLLRRRALNALARPMLNDAEEETDSDDESDDDSEDDENEEDGKTDNSATANNNAPPVRLRAILSLIQAAFEEADKAAEHSTPMSPADVVRLSWAVNAVSFGNSNGNNNISNTQADRSRYESENIENAVKVLGGLGAMAASYLRSLHSHSARTQLPYFLEITPQIFAPLAKTLGILVKYSLAHLSSSDPEAKDGFETALCSLLTVIHAHIASLTLLKLETTKSRDALAVVGDSLLNVIFSLAEKRLDRAVTAPPVEDNLAERSKKTRASTEQIIPYGLSSDVMDTTAVDPRRGLGKRTKSEYTSPLFLQTPAKTDAMNGRLGGDDLAAVELPDQSFEEEGRQSNEVSYVEAETLAIKLLTMYFRVFVRSTQAQAAFLAKLWKMSSPTNMATSNTKGVVLNELRRHTAEALVAERSISYLVCQAPDSPRPSGDVPSCKRRLARVLGVPNEFHVQYRQQQRPTSEFYPPKNLATAASSPSSSSAALVRHMSSIDEGRTDEGENTPMLKRARFSSVSGRDSIQNRVRVRSVLGEPGTNKRTSGSLLKRRSQALLTIQRAARSFIDAGKEHNENTNSPRHSNTFSGSTSSSSGSSRRSLEELHPMGTKKKRIVTLEEVERILCSENNYLAQGKIPSGIVDWLQDAQDVVSLQATQSSSTSYSSSSSSSSSPSPALEPEEEAISRQLPEGFSLLLETTAFQPSSPSNASSPSNSSSRHHDEDERDLFTTFLDAVVEEEDVHSAVILRCIQDDLISRLLVLFQSRKYAIATSNTTSDGLVSGSGLSTNSGASASGTTARPSTSPSQSSVGSSAFLHQSHVEQTLLQHCKNLFNACSTKAYHDNQNSRPERSPQQQTDKRRRSSSCSSNRTRCIVEDITCELLERLNILSPYWGDGMNFLSPRLMELLQDRNVPMYLKSCATKLLCSFAKSKVRSNNSETIDVSIESLLAGPLFIHPSPVQEQEMIEVFLQDLARSPAQPIKISKALSLHSIVSRRRELRILTVQAKGKPSILEDVVRISAAAYLKHSGTAGLAYDTAVSIHHHLHSLLEQFSGIKEEDLMKKIEEQVRVPPVLVAIWKAAWESTRTIINVYRQSQRFVCVKEKCGQIVVEDNGMWRCEEGHVNDSYNVEEVYSYQEICAHVAARARVLLSLGAGSSRRKRSSYDRIDDEAYLNGRDHAKEESEEMKLVLTHAKRFISSAASDSIKAERLELYLRAKDRYSVYRLDSLKLLADTLSSLLSLKAKTKRIDDDRGLTVAEEEARLPLVRGASIEAAATIGAERERGSTKKNPAVVRTTNLSEVNLLPILETIKEVYQLMSKPKENLGHNPLDFQLPSSSAALIQATSHEIIHLLLDVALGAAGALSSSRCTNSFSCEEEISMVLEVLQIVSLKSSDHMFLEEKRLGARLVKLVNLTAEYGEPYIDGAAWSVFSRMTLQVLTSSWGDDEAATSGEGSFRNLKKRHNGSKNVPPFTVGFDDLQTSFAMIVFSELTTHVETLRDAMDPRYEVGELLCYRFLCLLGALCSRSNITHNFTLLLNSSSSSSDDENLIVSLIACASPRVQQLAIRLGRRLLAGCNSQKMTRFLFSLAGEWSLSIKGHTSAGRAADLALETASMLRYLAAKEAKGWRVTVLQECKTAASEYLTTKFDSSPDILYRFWTTFAILNMSAPSTLRAGCRVKVVPGSGFAGWNETKLNQEYGIVVRAAKRMGGNSGTSSFSPPSSPTAENSSPRRAFSSSSINSVSSVGSIGMSYLESSSCMVILDSDPTKLPTKYDADKLLPVTIMHEEYKDLVVALRDEEWLLDSIELFTSMFWSATMSSDMVWCEFKAMAMSVLHAWLSLDSAYSIKQIASVRPSVWRSIVEICACPAPTSSLENVDDLRSTCQAFNDIKSVLCELGVSPMDSIHLKESSFRTPSNTPVKTMAKKQSSITAKLEALDMALAGEGAESSGEGDTEEEHKSLLSTPLLQPGRRSALARQASTQMFARKQSSQINATVVNESTALQEPQSETSSISSELVPESPTNHGKSPPSSLVKRNSGTMMTRRPSSSPLRRYSSSSSTRSVVSASGRVLDRRSSSGFSSLVVSNIQIGHNERAKKSVKFFESCRSEISLESPFREMDREDQSSYIMELHVERNRRRARMERKRRAARRLRTLSSSSPHSPTDSYPSTRVASLSSPPIPRSLSDSEDVKDSVPLPSLCQPDTPRGRDAASLPLPVELPTVDTMLSLPGSSANKPSKLNIDTGQQKTKEASRAVVKEGTLLRISHEETGVVKKVQTALNGIEMAYVHVFNSRTGLQSKGWRDIRALELSEDMIADRYRLFMGGKSVLGGSSSSGPYGISATSKVAYLNHPPTPTSRFANSSSSSNPATKSAKDKLSRELRHLCSRSAILNARRGAVAAISGSITSFPSVASGPSAATMTIKEMDEGEIVGQDNWQENDAKMQLLVGEAGGASQILGMLKLCESSSSSDFTSSTSTPSGSSFGEQGTSGLWKAVAVLFRSNDDFADMLLDEAILFLSITAKDTLFFETPHPLCPVEELDDGDEERDTLTDEEENGNGEEEEVLSIMTGGGESIGGGSERRQSSSTPPVRGRRSSSPVQPPVIAAAIGGDTMNEDNVIPPAPPPTSSGSSHNRSVSPSPSPSSRSSSSHFNNRPAKLSGSHRFFIKGASGLLVEFDRRSSIISAATQVTLSYDPQDREVVKVLGEGGADAWQPVVVSGDTCYIHWNVNHVEIVKQMQRMEELHVDIDEVAWGVAVRVRSLEEISKVDEMQVLEKPFGWGLMKVIADHPGRVLERPTSGFHFFDTAVNYLRADHLAFKPELCEVLTLLVRARMEQKKSQSEADRMIKWDDIIRTGLYMLHHDLLLLFDEVAEDGFTSVSPYFVCLLELLVLCRPLWALQPEELKQYQGKGKAVSSYSTKAPLCSLVVFGRRENSKVVVDCETCRLTGSFAVCLSCAATCHIGHILCNERTTTFPCGCSLRGPELCCGLRPFADVWKIGATDRTWFDVVCQTADVIDCISTGNRSIPLPFIKESYKTCSDGKLLRLCLRSLEECLRSEVQDVWWDRESRHMWANMLDQGMDSIAEVAFGLKVLVSSLLPSAFLFWWADRKEDWFKRIHTNQAWALAQAMLQFNYALAPGACYSEWDSRLANWSATLAGISGLGGEDTCTFLLTAEFPKPQVYVKCKTCDMEICEYCASKHEQDGHDLSDETFAAGFCDSRTKLSDVVKEAEDREDVGMGYKPNELFSSLAVDNFNSLYDLYWMNHDAETVLDDQVPTEPRTLAALLNTPHNAFSALENVDTLGDTPLVRCCSESGMLSSCLLGILIELLGVKEDASFLCLACDKDHGLSLTVGALLASGCTQLGGSKNVHGLVSEPVAKDNVMVNLYKLRRDFGVPLAAVSVFSGDITAHVNGSNAIEGMLDSYDRIFVNGVCTLEQLDALSSMLPLDGALLCPMVSSLGYGIYVQRNQFTGECENRTLAPLYQDSEKFLDEIAFLKNVTLQENQKDDDEKDDGVDIILEEYKPLIEQDVLSMVEKASARETLFERIGEVWPVKSWISLSDFATSLAGRETASLGFRDITNRSISSHPLLQQVDDVDVVRGRFAVLKRVNDSLSEVLPLINLTPQYSAGGIGMQLSRLNTKKLIFLSTKLDAWSKVLEPSLSEAPASVMPSITVSRKLAELGLQEDSLFMQTYNQVQNFPACSLRRRDQAFKVRFAGEGGHDVGGLYRELLSSVCGEVRDGKIPLLFHPNKMSADLGEVLLPRPSLISPVDLRLYEFLGALIGIACLRHGVTLSFDVSPLVWKALVKDELQAGDLKYIDDVALQTVSFVRNGKKEEFEYVFSDTVFAIAPIESSTSTDDEHQSDLVELCVLGKERKVSGNNALEYVKLLQRFRLAECQTQIDAMRRGITPLVPARLLPMFTWQELGNLVCGVSDVDVEFLHSRTKYVGGVKITDQHIKFLWSVLLEFTPQERNTFLKFVWGKERLSEEDGSMFVIGPHLRARDSGDPDKWLPVAHTCFFSLDLPNYSSKEITRNKLLFAMNNSVSIDADDTAEGSANLSLILT